jgi:transcriptional regulator with XRE-family HTH domain
LTFNNTEPGKKRKEPAMAKRKKKRLTVGKILNRLLRAYDWSPEDLAGKSDVDVQSIQDCSDGESVPTNRDLRKMAKALIIPPECFLWFKDKERPGLPADNRKLFRRVENLFVRQIDLFVDAARRERKAKK